MNPAPSGDDELPIEQRKTPPSHTSPAAGPSVIKSGRFSFVASILLIAIAFSLGLSYLLEKRWPQSSVNLPSDSPVSGQAPGQTAPRGSFHADMLHVTAVFPGPTRSAMVNGRRVAEGDSFMIPLPSGPVAVQLTRVEDGVAHFICQGERVDVKVKATIAQHSP